MLSVLYSKTIIEFSEVMVIMMNVSFIFFLEAKKEEKKEESEGSDDDMGFGLFD